MLLDNKLIEKIPDPRDSKEHYQLFMRKKNTKSVKQSKIIIYQTKTLENLNIADIKSFITENPKLHMQDYNTSCKIGFNSYLYSHAKK